MLGEADSQTSYNTLYVSPKGRTSRTVFAAALIPLLLAALWFLNKGPAVDYAPWGVLVMLYPAIVLHVRRLHDMGRSGWWVLVPAVLAGLTMGIWAKRIDLGAQLDAAVPIVALVACLGIALWGCVGKEKPATA